MRVVAFRIPSPSQIRILVHRVFIFSVDRLRIVISVLREAWFTFHQKHATEGAASIAFYSLFSLFPLLLVLIVAGSFMLQQSNVQQVLLEWVVESIPGSRELILQNIQQVLALRGTFGVVALISLVWSASGVFNTLAANINRAFPEAQARNFFTNRIVALAMIGGLVVIIFLLLFFNTIFRLLPHIDIPILRTGHQTTVWRIFSITSPILLNFLVFFLLYWWVPNTNVSRRAAFIGALTTTTISRLFTLMFSLYLGSGFDRYEIVYGSLGTIVALMFYIYLTGWIALFGAHMTASISRRIKGFPLNNRNSL